MLYERLTEEESGQGMVEYVLILITVSVAAVGAISGIGPKVSGFFQKVLTYL